MDHPTIIFTGGGSAGHVVPNLVLMEALLLKQWKIHYLGSVSGIERKLVAQLGIPYHAIATGKLRRYFSWQNFLDPWRVLVGISQSIRWCLKIRPQVIFSKGGFVALPVVVAAWLLRIPIIVHESDLTLGLANRISLPFATKLCTAFPIHLPRSNHKIITTGLPLRAGFGGGNFQQGRALGDFNWETKLLVVFGGSLGAQRINQLLRELLPELLADFQIAHICGPNGVDPAIQYPGYRQFEYLDQEFPDLLAAADLVVARAGASTIYELLALRKPHLLLPLGSRASRGDQLVNAQYCVSQGWCNYLAADQLNRESLHQAIQDTWQKRADLTQALAKFTPLPAVTILTQLIEQIATRK